MKKDKESGVTFEDINDDMQRKINVMQRRSNSVKNNNGANSRNA